MFGVQGKNENEEIVEDFSTERKLCVCNEYLKRKNVDKYNRIARGR